MSIKSNISSDGLADHLRTGIACCQPKLVNILDVFMVFLAGLDILALLELPLAQLYYMFVIILL